MRLTPKIIGALAAAMLLFHVTVAAAQPPSDIDKDAARLSLEQGDERMAAKDYPAALQAYQRADAIMAVPTTSIEVGRAAEAMGKIVIAHDAYRRAVDYPKKRGEPPAFTKARAKARTRAKALAPKIPTLELSVNGPEGDADIEVLIDEVPIDAWGAAVRLDPGMHVIRAESLGFNPTSRDVVLQEGETRTLLLELTPLAGGDTVTESNPWWTVAAVSLPIGGAALITGVVTGALSLDFASQVKETCIDGSCPPEQRDNLESSRTLAHVSTTTLIVGGVGVALGAVALVFALTGGSDDDDEIEDDTSGDEAFDAELLIGPTSAGLVLHW